MKRLFISIAIASVLVACTKVKPDWDQTECGTCIEIVQHWSDTSATKFEVAPPDTTVDNKCGQMFRDFKTWRSGYYVKYCAANGEVLHYDYYINYVK